MERPVLCIGMTSLGVVSVDTVGSIDTNKAFEDHLQKVFNTALGTEGNDKQMQFDKGEPLQALKPTSVTLRETKIVTREGPFLCHL